jgi:hypothetical protein
MLWHNMQNQSFAKPFLYFANLVGKYQGQLINLVTLSTILPAVYW